MERWDQNTWVIAIEKNLKSMTPLDDAELWRKHSIYRVPPFITSLKRYAYSPQMVAFGPYHHHKQHLMPMEEHKTRALLYFLRRSNKSILVYLNALERVVEELMDSYENLDDEWRRDKIGFLQLMMRDGCFLHEILHTTEDVSRYYSENDPIFSRHGIIYNWSYIRRDVLLIENQVPLLVLQKLIEVSTRGTKNEEYINNLILKFCNINPTTFNIGLGLHVLDIVRKSMIQGPMPRSSTQTEQSTGSGEIIRSATELDEAGIQFRRNYTIREIKFRNGVLDLPVIIVDETTEKMLLNLMAFERLHFAAGNEVTSYVVFMDNIIKSARDVSLLHSKGIIENAIGNDAVVKLFNELSMDVTLDPDSSMAEAQKRVHDYCKNRWIQWRANLVHNYFRGAWSFSSFVGSLFFLCLTVAQTLYAILSYHNSK